MAQVDIKNARIYIKDGYAGPGGTNRVNNGAGYAAAAVTMTVDGFSGAVVVGDLFTVASDATNTVYTITAHSETLGATTSITFTPGLGDAVVDDSLITMLPHQLEITVGEGNVTWTEKHAREYKLNRGRLDKVRDGNQDPLEIKTEFTWENITASTGGTPTPVDVLKNIGEASDWVTAGSDPCEPFSVDLEILYTPICDSEQLERIKFPDFRFEQLDFDLQKGTCSLGGKCNVIEPVVTREDQ